MTTESVRGYLPTDRPAPAELMSLAFQHVLTMFPATTLVAILTHFDIGVTLFAAGLATIVALLVAHTTRRTYIPLWYGSSFGFIAPVAAVVAANGVSGVQVAQVGIIGAALLNVVVGALAGIYGKEHLDRILPPVVTGSVAIVIGIALSRAALDMAAGTCCLTGTTGGPVASGTWWLVAIITLLATVLCSVYLRGRGLIGMLPVLCGALVGYVVAFFFGLVDLGQVFTAPWFRIPPFSAPAFGHPGAWYALLAIAPIAIATIPESTAHLYQIALYSDRLADELRRRRPDLARFVGLNLVLNGLADLICGAIGGTAGTNYGENNSLMVITRNYSGPVLIGAGVIAMLLGFVGKLAVLVSSVPTAVVGGLMIYLFGIIGLQGIALMMAKRVNLFDPRNLAVGAVILVIGIGGNTFPGGAIPLGPWNVPAIATAAVVGIVLNLVFVFFPVAKSAGEEQAAYTSVEGE